MKDIEEQYIVGVDLGGTEVKAAISDNSGILYRVKQPVSKEKDKLALPDQIHNIIRYIRSKVKIPVNRKKIIKHAIYGIGIGTPGPFLQEKGHTTIYADNLAIKGIPMEKRLAEHWGYSNVIIENDLGAKVWGMGRLQLIRGMKQHDIGVMNPGTGYGTDAIIKFRDIETGEISYGKILGKNGNGMEAGHEVIFPNHNSRCKCGNFGDLEIMASGSGMERRYFAKAGKKASCKEIFDLYKNDRNAREVVDDSIKANGIAIANLTNVLDTKTWYVIGNPIKDYTEAMIKKLNGHVMKSNPKIMLKDIRIIVANKGSPYEKLEEYASAVGSTSLVMPKSWVKIWNRERPWEHMPEAEKLPADFFRK